jgi:hypothetical protein
VFIGDKKTKLHSDDCRPQNTLYFGLGRGLGTNPGSDSTLLDDAPKAKWHYCDGFDVYQWLWYHLGWYEISKSKSETYSAKADNSELHHYLTCLTPRLHCFSRCPYALECALHLFIVSIAGNFTDNIIQITRLT